MMLTIVKIRKCSGCVYWKSNFNDIEVLVLDGNSDILYILSNLMKPDSCTRTPQFVLIAGRYKAEMLRFAKYVRAQTRGCVQLGEAFNTDLVTVTHPSTEEGGNTKVCALRAVKSHDIQDGMGHAAR